MDIYLMLDIPYRDKYMNLMSRDACSDKFLYYFLSDLKSSKSEIEEAIDKGRSELSDLAECDME